MSSDKRPRPYGRPWPDPVHGPWLVRLRFGEVDGVRECVGLDIRSMRVPREPAKYVHVTPTKLTGTVLRELPLGELIREWRLLESKIWERESYRLEGKPRREAQRRAAEWGDRPRRGRPGHGADFYAEVATVYIAAKNRRESPVTAIQQWYWHTYGGDALPSKSAATKWVYRARHDYGLLD